MKVAIVAGLPAKWNMDVNASQGWKFLNIYDFTK
jgi:hypothetical protein